MIRCQYTGASTKLHLKSKSTWLLDIRNPKFTEFFKKNFNLDSSQFCSLQIGTKLTTQASKPSMFDSIFIKLEAASKMINHIGNWTCSGWMICMLLLHYEPEFIASQIDRPLPVICECSAEYMILNFRTWEFVIVTVIAAFNCVQLPMAF